MSIVQLKQLLELVLRLLRHSVFVALNYGHEQHFLECVNVDLMGSLRGKQQKFGHLSNSVLEPVQTHEDHPAVIVVGQNFDSLRVTIDVNVGLLDHGQRLLVAQRLERQLHILAVEGSQGHTVGELAHQEQHLGDTVLRLAGSDAEIGELSSEVL